MAAENAAVMSSFSQTMQSMQVSSKQIGDIVGVIDGLAFQTNFLPSMPPLKLRAQASKGGVSLLSPVKFAAWRNGLVSRRKKFVA